MRANVKHNHVLHQHVVVLSVETMPVPVVDDRDRIQVDDLGHVDDGIVHVNVRTGYMETPDVPAALRLARKKNPELDIEPDDTSYFVSTIELRVGDEPGMARWRKRLFVTTSTISADAADYFGLPRDRTVIMGSHIEV